MCSQPVDFAARSMIRRPYSQLPTPFSSPELLIHVESCHPPLLLHQTLSTVMHFHLLCTAERGAPLVRPHLGHRQH